MNMFCAEKQENPKQQNRVVTMPTHSDIQSKTIVEPIEFKVSVLTEGRLRIEPHHPQHGRVGHAHVSRLDESLWRLDEISIDEKISIRAGYQLRIGRWDFGQKPITISLRNRGIGTALMDYLKDYLQQHGAKEIEATPPHRDLDNAFHLLRWYKKQGFKIAVRSPNSGAGVDARLVWRSSGQPATRAA